MVYSPGLQTSSKRDQDIDPVCARFPKTTKQGRKTNHPRSPLDALKMEHGVLQKYIQAPSFYFSISRPSPSAPTPIPGSLEWA